jgi:hypothetical protein
MDALNASRRDDHHSCFPVPRLFPRHRDQIHNQCDQYSTQETVRTAQPPRPRRLGRLSWRPLSWPEQIPDDRERRDQQHAHDDAAADAVDALLREQPKCFRFSHPSIRYQQPKDRL